MALVGHIGIMFVTFQSHVSGMFGVKTYVGAFDSNIHKGHTGRVGSCANTKIC